MSQQYYCRVCNRTMDEDQFYMSKRLDKYPEGGHLLECKKCVTRHVDNWDPKTYLNILEEIDVPYIEEEWTKLMKKYAQDPSKVTGTTIIGRYLSKMKLKQFRDYHWEDTEKIRAEKDQLKADIMARQGYSGEEIEQAIAAGTMPDDLPRPAPVATHEPEEISAPVDMIESAYFNDDLTDEDKKYLTIKWGKTYKPYEWVQLEQYYEDMMNAFDIQTPAHIDYLKLICKTSLKAHQLIDLGDVEGFQKMSKTYDTLMKSAKFTAAQNKAESGEFVDSVSELVLLCEKEGFIPRYYTDGPQDKVDRTLEDLRSYTHTLVTEELNLGTLIEGAIKTLQRQAEKDAMIDDDDEDIDDEEIFEQQVDQMLNDQDFVDFNEFIEEDMALDVEEDE